jgi:DNA-3-methyladenine glycosylase II
MDTLTIRPQGPYDLGSAISFLSGWPPTASDQNSAATLRWATCIEDTWNPVEIEVSANGTALRATFRGGADEEAVSAHVSRVLSVDIDGTGMAGIGALDPIAGELIADSPGLRPVCFWTPYEAAVWGVISQRSSMTQASRTKNRIAAEHGEKIADLAAFPSPSRLLALTSLPGVSSAKLERLHAVAEAALEGLLDPTALRAVGTDEALERLRTITGIGPFSAELILVRGAGHPDVFPSAEQRLHAAMRAAYHRPAASVAELAAISGAWAPYRSWVSFLFRRNAAGLG